VSKIRKSLFFDTFASRKKGDRGVKKEEFPPFGRLYNIPIRGDQKDVFPNRWVVYHTK
jgi:hypothetical protein